MKTSQAATILYRVVPAQPARNRLLVWSGRVLRWFLLTLVAVVVIGASYQTLATARDAQAYPPPGQLIDVGGYRLHIYCSGPTDSSNPTVILEAGLGGTTAAWAWVQPAVAQTTRVCAYDRAGMGGSEPSPGPHDAQHIAQALHTLLHNANLAGPYVLVGWSYGGLYLRAFTEQYRPEVAGLVLLDSSYPDQCTSTPAGAAQCKTASRIYAIAPLLARVGVMRVMARFQPASGLPEPQNAHLLASFAASKDWAAQSAEFLAAPTTNAQVRATQPLDSIPLVVVTATEHGTTPDLEQLWQGWQREMATLSTNSLHQVVAGASHGSLVYNANDAQSSVAAILQVVAAVQMGKPLRSQ